MDQKDKKFTFLLYPSLSRPLWFIDIDLFPPYYSPLLFLDLTFGGTPIPCTALVPYSDPNDFLPKCLELPPRLLIDKLPSPTTVLDGPGGGSNRFKSASFRVAKDCYGSFSTERGQLGAMVFTKEKRRFCSWRRKAIKVKREVSGGSHVFPSSADREYDGGFSGDSQSARVKMTKMKRCGSFSSHNHSKSRFWATI
ncbi:hypothetical protein L6164_016830 [Bauhinia variegata]|uniref:Uncharacterized protein n=1 Tax=Bauhinia variegata TaxID=167791 RepID=A0ACB9N7X6_BAUVA|nr:hypothetical protein L6164_016830 [Bauhinia variegata]